MKAVTIEGEKKEISSGSSENSKTYRHSEYQRKLHKMPSTTTGRLDISNTCTCSRHADTDTCTHTFFF